MGEFSTRHVGNVKLREQEMIMVLETPDLKIAVKTHLMPKGRALTRSMKVTAFLSEF